MAILSVLYMAVVPAHTYALSGRSLRALLNIILADTILQLISLCLLMRPTYMSLHPDVLIILNDVG